MRSVAQTGAKGFIQKYNGAKKHQEALLNIFCVPNDCVAFILSLQGEKSTVFIDRLSKCSETSLSISVTWYISVCIQLIFVFLSLERNAQCRGGNDQLLLKKNPLKRAPVVSCLPVGQSGPSRK